MTARIGVRELRDRLTATIRRVRDGETIEVTHHGVPIALISPVSLDRIERLVARGDLTLGKPLARKVQRLAVTGDMTASEALEADRADR